MTDWHEAIAVTLRQTTPQPLTALQVVLSNLGFVTNADEEMFWLPRADVVESWQTDTLLAIHVYLEGREVYFSCDGQWDSLEAIYLLPWQPIANASTFVETSFCLASKLGLSVSVKGSPTSPEHVLALCHSAAADLAERVEAPGGNFLAQAIAEKLPL